MTVKTRLELVQKHVNCLRSFYIHLFIYVVVSSIFLFWIFSKASLLNQDTLQHWVLWNALSMPIIWGVFLACHGWKVYRQKQKIKNYGTV